MSETRVKVITEAFQKADKTGDGIITVEDLKVFYCSNKNDKKVYDSHFLGKI